MLSEMREVRDSCRLWATILVSYHFKVARSCHLPPSHSFSWAGIPQLSTKFTPRYKADWSVSTAMLFSFLFTHTLPLAQSTIFSSKKPHSVFLFSPYQCHNQKSGQHVRQMPYILQLGEFGGSSPWTVLIHSMCTVEYKSKPQWVITSPLLKIQNMESNKCKNVQKGERIYIFGRDANYCSHCGKQCGNFLS